MAVKAKHACTHGKQYARAGGRVGQVAGGTEHPGRAAMARMDNWDVSTT
jgi:hypothetical protein